MKIIILLLSILASGCAVVMWNGELPAREYQITFISATKEPISGITPTCSGNDIWPSEEIAKDINKNTEPSSSNGLLVLSHTGYSVGGSYKKLGSIKWGYSEPEKVVCSFNFNGKVISSGDLNTYHEPKTIVVNIEKI